MGVFFRGCIFWFDVTMYSHLQYFRGMLFPYVSFSVSDRPSGCPKRAVFLQSKCLTNSAKLMHSDVPSLTSDQ